MNKSKKLLCLVCCAALMGACYTPNKKYASTDLKHPQKGGFSNVVPVSVKDFKTVGIVYATSKVTYDINGDKIGSEITYEQLMREVEKLGGDDVINVRIDQRDMYDTQDTYRIDAMSNEEKFSGREYFPKETIYTATGLAIKYLTAAESPFMPTEGAASEEDALGSTYVAPVASAPGTMQAAPKIKATPVKKTTSVQKSTPVKKSAPAQKAVRRSMFSK